ncbi:MAG: Asp-tRNA(Asn)/Glu-tRNA(Gln) amidotransferase subunit GatA [Bdellovibrionales bacterium]|nr:Asp-tRNA(Asn)/Glu-tRNA(Gln) amidotransferase subunit GatA [Bdellovibrionales bacterium]
MTESQQPTLTDTIERLSRKKISSVELTHGYLQAIRDHSELGAFISVDEDKALEAAALADKAGPPDENQPLRGIPIAVKDLFVTASGTTTCASQFLKGYESPFTATSVQKLYDAGAFCIGKTNLDEFAMGSSNENSSFGPVKNPWDTTRVPGGSSGGSAAAVAAQLAPVALGTDTGGSIRQPAAMCGISGLKPTYGRISRYGMIAFASSLDQAGPMAVSAKDCALVARIMAGADRLDATSVDKPITRWEEPIPNVFEGLRIGVPKQYLIDGVDPEVLSAVDQAISQLEKLGATRVEISLPHTEFAVACYYVIAAAEASSNLARFDGIRFGARAQEISTLTELYERSRTEGFGSEVKRRILLGTYVLSSGYYDAYYLKAQKVRTLIQRDFQDAFEHECDLIACPTAPTTAFPLGEKTADPLQMYLADVFTIPGSLAGIPVLSVPCGFDGNHLPVGIQLIGQAWDEHRLLSVAQRYQEETTWHLQAPPLLSHGGKA